MYLLLSIAPWGEQLPLVSNSVWIEVCISYSQFCGPKAIYCRNVAVPMTINNCKVLEVKNNTMSRQLTTLHAFSFALLVLVLLVCSGVAALQVYAQTDEVSVESITPQEQMDYLIANTTQTKTKLIELINQTIEHLNTNSDRYGDIGTAFTEELLNTKAELSSSPTFLSPLAGSQIIDRVTNPFNEDRVTQWETASTAFTETSLAYNQAFATVSRIIGIITRITAASQS